MHAYPHEYSASASGARGGPVAVSSPELPGIETTAPPQFGGPGGHWSPETLLCASLADCFVLTFRAVSRAARLEWSHVDCRVEGTLEQAQGVSKFTRFRTVATVTIAENADPDAARKLLARAEHGCLIANSLAAERVLEADVKVAAAVT